MSALRREREVRPRVVAECGRAEVERRNWWVGVFMALEDIVLAERRMADWNADAMTYIL